MRLSSRSQSAILTINHRFQEADQAPRSTPNPGPLLMAHRCPLLDLCHHLPLLGAALLRASDEENPERVWLAFKRCPDGLPWPRPRRAKPKRPIRGRLHPHPGHLLLCCSCLNCRPCLLRRQ